MNTGIIKYCIPEDIISGIYKITAPDGYYYIGSTKNFISRYKLHVTRVKRNVHENIRIQNKYNKHPLGWAFNLVKEVFDLDELLNIEASYLKESFGKKECMNINPNAVRPPSALGKKFLNRKPWSKKRRLEHRKWRLGYIQPASVRLKIQKALTGVRKTPIHIAINQLAKLATGRYRKASINRSALHQIIADPKTSEYHLDLALAYLSY